MAAPAVFHHHARNGEWVIVEYEGRPHPLGSHPYFAGLWEWRKVPGREWPCGCRPLEDALADVKNRRAA